MTKPFHLRLPVALGDGLFAAWTFDFEVDHLAFGHE